jgi:hypothetical protein
MVFEHKTNNGEARSTFAGTGSIRMPARVMEEEVVAEMGGLVTIGVQVAARLA